MSPSVFLLLSFAASALSFNVAPDSKLPALRTPESKLPPLRSGGILKNSKQPSVAPQSKVLAFRGGGVVSNEVLVNTMAVLFMIVGLQGWVSPDGTLAQYGVTKEITAQESTYLRILSGINFVAGVTMFASEETAVRTCLVAWALSTCSNVPLLEKFDAPKAAIVGFAGAFVVLAELSRQGILGAEPTLYIAAFLLIVVSLPEIVNPQQTLDMFGMPNASALTKSLFGNFSFIKVCTGLFLLVRQLTGKAGFALAAALFANNINIIKTILGADAAGLGKPGLIAWGVIQTAVGGLALANDL